MSFNNVGPLTSLAEGETAFWHYSFGGDQGSRFATADIKTPNAGAVLLAFDQEKQINNDGHTTYFVSIRNLGPGSAFHNLQGGGLA